MQAQRTLGRPQILSRRQCHKLHQARLQTPKRPLQPAMVFTGIVQGMAEVGWFQTLDVAAAHKLAL